MPSHQYSTLPQPQLTQKSLQQLRIEGNFKGFSCTSNNDLSNKEIFSDWYLFLWKIFAIERVASRSRGIMHSVGSFRLSFHLGVCLLFMTLVCMLQAREHSVPKMERCLHPNTFLGLQESCLKCIVPFLERCPPLDLYIRACRFLTFRD